MANTGPPAARPQPVKQETMGPMGNDMDPKTSLPTFIYDYFLKKGKLDLASALLKSDLQVNTRPRTKRSPDGREINGGDSAMDSDPKLDSIPEANIAEQLPNESFLQDWWFVFWDIWSAGKNKNASDAASRFLNQRNQQMKQQQQQQALQQNMMMRGVPGGFAGMRNNNNMRNEAIMNNRNMAQMRNMNGLTAQQQAQLQAQGGDVNMGGQPRAQSPMSNDAPSPKRPRVDGPNFGTPQMNPGARNPGAPIQMPNGPGQTPGMMPNGLDPMSAGPFNGMGNPGQNKMQQFGAMSRTNFGVKPEFPGGPGMMGDFDPMMDMSADGMRAMGNGGNPQGGALADYQMQLMLLEQQNKKRLLMARQEQEVQVSGGGGPPGTTQAMMGGAGPFQPGLSPRRNGQSPSPNDPMKRGNSNMGQASPRPEGQMRASPAPSGFDPTQMPAGIAPQFYNAQMGKMGGEGMMGPNGMGRGIPGGFPGANPNISQLDMMRARQQPGMPAAMYGGQGPQAPLGNMAQMQQQNPNNSQQNPMPPPQAPNPAGNAGRTNPSSPQQNPNPPTPSQTKAANPKGSKKDTAKEKKAKQPKKGPNTTTATPSSEADGNGPPTPTPPTPITPVGHDNPFSKTANGPRLSNGQPQPQNNGASNAIPAQQEGQPFGALEGSNDMDFGDFGVVNLQDNTDVLEGFDFDSFLHDPQDQTFGFDASGFNMSNEVEMGSRDA